MVQSFVETLSVEVIKVTIKDKPDLQTNIREDDYLSEAFKALKENAKQERKVREFKIAFEKKISKERTHRLFKAWYDWTKKAREISEHAKARRKLSNDERIELLVGVLAEKQKETKEKEVEKKLVKKVGKTGDRLKKNKNIPSLAARMESRSNNRVEMQKLVIQEQKAKLAEQSKTIEEMKLKEIEVETKERSKETIKVAKQALRQCDQRTRRSLIHLMREQGCRDLSVDEIPDSSKPGNFLLRLEARAETRKQRLKQAEEIRQRKRDEQKRKEEKERREAEEKERLAQIQAQKEARRHRKEQEERRLKKAELDRKLEQMADLCYKRYLFRRYALEPFNILLEEKYKRLHRADKHYSTLLLSRIFLAWKNDWLTQQNLKFQLATKFDRRNSLYRSFDEWRNFALDMRYKSQVATDFYDIKLQGKFIRALNLLRINVKLQLQEKEKQAISHHHRRLIAYYFAEWKVYVEVADDINEREQRRDEWRDLIKKFIPGALTQLRHASLHN